MLALGHAHNEPVELGRDLDLAGKPSRLLPILREIEHGLFHVLLRRNFRSPCRIDIDMTGGAGAGPAAVGIDAGNEILHCPFHDRPAGRHLDLMYLPAMLNIFDFRHGFSSNAPYYAAMFFMAMAASASLAAGIGAPSAMSLRPTRYSGAALTASTAATPPSR